MSSLLKLFVKIINIIDSIRVIKTKTQFKLAKEQVYQVFKR